MLLAWVTFTCAANGQASGSWRASRLSWPSGSSSRSTSPRAQWHGPAKDPGPYQGPFLPAGEPAQDSPTGAPRSPGIHPPPPTALRGRQDRLKGFCKVDSLDAIQMATMFGPPSSGNANQLTASQAEAEPDRCQISDKAAKPLRNSVSPDCSISFPLNDLFVYYLFSLVNKLPRTKTRT